MAIAVLALLQATPLAAASDDWVAVRVRGTVIHLVGSQWEEFARGGVLFDGQALRTLQGGRVQLQRDDQSISLGPNTTVEIDQGGQGTPLTIKQYSGSIFINASPGDPGQIAVETPVLSLVTSGGAVSVAFDDDAAKVSVGSGSVSVVDRLHGDEAVLGAGESLTNSASDGMGLTGVDGLPASVDAAGTDVVPPDATAGLEATSASGGDSANLGGSGGGDSGNSVGNGNGEQSGDIGNGND